MTLYYTRFFCGHFKFILHLSQKFKHDIDMVGTTKQKTLSLSLQTAGLWQLALQLNFIAKDAYSYSSLLAVCCESSQWQAWG